jgi:hypothetical protein
MNSKRYEKLKIVFDIEVEPSAEEYQLGRVVLGQFVQVSGLTDIHALRTIIGIMRQFDLPTEFKENGKGKTISVSSYLKHVEKQGKWSRPVEAGGLSFHFGRMPALKQAFISIEDVNANSTVSWADWVKPFLAEDSFVQAWVSDVEYDYWQNAKDLLEYEAVGRSYSHLPTKSNGLPAPLEQIEIDTSNNPGRWSLHSGYLEAIGSTMWLGDSFWQRVGENRKETLLSAGWLIVQSVEKDVIQVIASEHCFCDETTEVIQNNLRAILYG